MTQDPSAPPLPRSPSAAVGIPAASVLGVLDELDARGLELHSLMVVRHGSVAAQGWWAPYSPDRVHLLYSLSKSFTSSAVAFAVAEGLCSLTDLVVDLLPDHVPADLDDRVAALTLHDVLSMSTGHREDTLDRAYALEPHDVAKGFLRLRPDDPIGSRHAYNNACTYVAGLVVQERSGQFLLDYLRPRLLEPLGIRPGRWDADAGGRALGFSGLHQRTHDIARFGQLLLQRGRWQGEQLLPAGWVELATGRHVDNRDPGGNADWSQGYGYQYWRSRHGYRGDGAFGQFCVVVPEADLVIATTGCTEDMQAVLDVFWDVLLPGLDTVQVGEAGEAGEAAAQLQLTDRLEALALPVVTGTLEAAAAPRQPVTFTVEPGPTGPYASPIPAGSWSPDGPLAPGASLTVSPGAPDAPDAPDGDTLLDLVLGDVTLRVPCGRGRWAEGRLGSAPGVARGPRALSPMPPTPVVCRGGWTTAETFEADLVLIETPHRIRLTGTGSVLQATWNVAPLAGRRLEAHLPW
ncbi:serine hydrolase [Dermatophilaceae bacterium Soc4.6]